ncbi:uncharacterized protein [Halyomorpha halys]|uniref:uncharacterized protein isoform X2 n=1 Tax=Halyomorpha halys TaxID=286706 RepID=UPI0006D51F66|nr:uncharacterized protein LOC106688700 isoform X2 [Halyomorpha halys]
MAKLTLDPDQELPTDSVSDTEETGSQDAENFVKNEEESFVEQSITSNVKREPSRNENVYVPEVKLSRKRPFLGEPVEMCSTTLGTKCEGISEFDAVGINIAKKLAKMDPMQAVFAESLISVILRKGLLEQLTEDTNVCKCECGKFQTIQS